MSTLPDWMSKKVSGLADERARRDGVNLTDVVNLISGDAFTTLSAELATFPELAKLSPSTLGRNIRTGAFCALSAFELAAIVITDADAQTASIVAGPNDLAEFTTLKWQSLGSLLQEAENV
jgi:hypothetical protein